MNYLFGEGMVKRPLNGESKRGLIETFHRAAIHGYTKVLKGLIEAQMGVDARDRNGYTAFELAVTAGVKESVDILIENGALNNTSARYSLHYQ